MEVKRETRRHSAVFDTHEDARRQARSFGYKPHKLSRDHLTMGRSIATIVRDESGYRVDYTVEYIEDYEPPNVQ